MTDDHAADAADDAPSSPAPDSREFRDAGATDGFTTEGLTTDGLITDELAAEVDLDPEDLAILELTAERDEYRDIAQRVQAEFENFRKQSIARQAAEVDRATGAFAEALLPVLDAAEAAYVAHPDEVGPLFNLLLGELRKRGLEPMELLDQPFDPNLADAVAHEPGDGGEPRVAEVLRSGYTWKGKTLRAAMVRTAD